MKYFLMASLGLLILACSSSQKARDAKEDALFNKWLHHSKTELIQAWGQPDSIKSDGKRGEILIYKEGTDASSVMNGKYTGKQFSFRKEMYISADSVIYYWRSWRRK